MATLTTPGLSEVAPDETSGAHRRTPESRFDKRAWRKAVALLHLCLAVLVAVYVLQGGGGAQEASGDDSSSTLREADAAGTATVVDPASARPEARGLDSAVRPVPPPHVRDVVRADFTQGDPWPVGAASRDTATVSWPMGIVDGVFVHGPADGLGAVSWLDRALDTNVRAVGARVRFASAHSGAVALTAWQTSVLDESGTSLPRTGMRLVATPGSWSLVALDVHGTATLATGSYERANRTASFSLVRRGSDLWVTDPTGRVTQVSDPRVASLAGPWASWELRDDGPRSRPAALEEIWAG